MFEIPYNCLDINGFCLMLLQKKIKLMLFEVVKRSQEQNFNESAKFECNVQEINKN